MTHPTGQDALPGGSVAIKKYRAGTHRIVSAAETFEHVAQFFPALGITRVGDITGLDIISIPVITVCRPNSRSVVLAAGKGLDVMAARASGVMESIEAYMAERIDRPLLLASVNDVRISHPLVDVAALPRPTNSRYHPALPILWIEGQELFTGTPRWVPYEMVHTAYTLPAPSGTGCFIATSNGLASGNHLLEATSHALCEVVERDAATLHDIRPQADRALRRIDPETVDDPACREAIGRFDEAGISVQLWDISTDIGIPAFTCLITQGPRRQARTRRSSEGMGCHPDRGIALLRALTEAAQVRLASILNGSIEPRPPDRAAEAAAERSPMDAVAGRVGTAMRDFTAVPAFDGDSFDADVAWELGALRSVGIGEVVVVNLTREEFGVPVVRVIIPGLEGPTRTVSNCRLGRRAMDLISSK